MPTRDSLEFTPSSVINFKHFVATDNEEYELFGSPSSVDTIRSDNDDDDDDDVDDNDGSSGEDEMDGDTGTLNGKNFVPLLNVEALDFFVNNELLSTNSSVAVDYFHDECFMNMELSEECLLVAIYVYYFKLTQSKYFNRTMKKPWLGKSMQNKLTKIKHSLDKNVWDTSRWAWSLRRGAVHS